MTSWRWSATTSAALLSTSYITKTTVSLEVLPVGTQLCDALAQVHRTNVVHKDINPNNIIFNRDTHVTELIDFGIAARHIPFDALSQAFASIVRRLLMEPKATLEMHRRRLLKAVGRVGQALIDMAPSMELLLGKQTEIARPSSF